jgi:hypothetical protein
MPMIVQFYGYTTHEAVNALLARGVEGAEPLKEDKIFGYAQIIVPNRYESVMLGMQGSHIRVAAKF